MGKRVGNYEFKTRIGSGAFGTVFLGKHLPSKKQVAIKMIGRQTLTEEHQARLEQEILCQRSIDSEFVVQLIDVQKTDNNIYLILEYCEGGDLSKFLREHGPVDESTARRWMQQLAGGFKALHEKNIIHRDLKLQNLLMSPAASTDANLKICDFGLSRTLDERSLAQSCLGSPLYMAPEVIHPQHGYDSKADLWSLGVVLYEMLTGEPPLDAKRKEEIPQAQQNLKPIPESLSTECKDLLSRMLQYDSANRLSFQEFFRHPFISGQEKSLRDSIRASKGSSDAQSAAQEEEAKSPDSSGDYVIIDEENGQLEGFHALAIDSHPAVNLQEKTEELETRLEEAVVIKKFADKMRKSNEIIGTFALEVKCCALLKEAVDAGNDLIEKHRLSPISHPSFVQLHERVKGSFLTYVEGTERLCAEIEQLQERNEEAKLTSIDSAGKQGVADSLIYTYALTLCKEGAQDEYLRNLESSQEKYKEAVCLLAILCRSQRDSEDESEWKRVESLLSDARKRLDTVLIKLATV